MNTDTENHSTESPEQISTDPLPCRGCTKECSHYGECEGKPWRLNDKSES